MSSPERRRLVDHADATLSVVAQCRLLKIARSTLYYRAVPVSEDDLALMRRMDELYVAAPFYGSRRMAAVLRGEELAVRGPPQSFARADDHSNPASRTQEKCGCR
jgi:putative transposase